LREGLFIKKNKDRWERLEHQTPVSPDEMASDFTRLVDDLAYAKTFYPTSRVTQYVNSLAAKIYLGIYKNRREESNRLVRFWKYDVPVAVGKHHLVVLFALIIFFVFFAVGFFSSVKEPGFVREVLGNGYVDMTEKNIREGNPFNVYANENSFVMWMWIMVNNILVSFRYFFRGIALGVPCLFDLGKESIRLGAFEHMFYAKGLGAQAVTTVLIHGMLELTAIIITCAAGVVMGTGYLFPKTGRRFDAFREGAKDGVKMVLGLIPIFMVAAFFEGYVTRYYKMPLPLSLIILMITGSFVVWYFGIYPIKLKNKLRVERGLPANG
jgi:uncharacterized membrane protein SpoIIM required for sporulation